MNAFRLSLQPKSLINNYDGDFPLNKVSGMIILLLPTPLAWQPTAAAALATRIGIVSAFFPYLKTSCIG